ncbi:protein-L-isoaspartate O-methyltransferase family protein [Leptothrix ochracea]|uniref:protein-L-isoaspartate O-methyltransferase family protein n=1 Tax=Leptothrix ochracea TaxID=735331 RepID=UPI001FDED449|nr:protein-L-isoaspartate O-methyltransferase [Leptothrix ochracea]
MSLEQATGRHTPSPPLGEPIATPSPRWHHPEDSLEASMRMRMVDQLRAIKSFDERILAVMARVERHRFIDTALASQAYVDTSLPIGLGQTISKPSIIARMLSLLCQRPGMNAWGVPSARPLGKVLEIGTGCGYQATLLAELSREVYSVERLKLLFDRARDAMAPIRAANLRLIYADGCWGHPPNAPYDGIVAAAACHGGVPLAWIEQLAPGGRLVAPVYIPNQDRQILWMVDRLADHTLQECGLEDVHFVPLESGICDSGLS